MTSKATLTMYFIILFMGYAWAFIQFVAGEPFDALVLFIVTYFLHNYRNAVRKAYDER